MKTKSELIAAMAEKTGITKADTEKMLSVFISVVSSELIQGKKVRLDGIGILSPVTRAARKAHNPQNPMQKVDVPAKKTVTFKPGADLKREMNG